MIEQFHWLRPLWLLAIVPALLLTILLWRARSSGANWRRAIAPDLLDHLLDHRGERRVRWPWWLAFAGWMLGCLALAGPVWEKLPQPVLQKRDALVVVRDLSLSMTAADVQPSRLQRARYKILDLLQRRQEGLTGLVAYAGDAHVVTPLTDDTATIANLVPALSPDMMPIYGSDVGGGIEQALQLLQSSGVARGRILLVTDGIENADIAGVGEAIGKTAHTLSILGVGTAQGAPIPIQGGFFKNSDGSIAIPQLHRDRLQRLATKTGGVYRDLSVDDGDLDQLLPDAAQPDDALRTTERQFDQWRERGPWLVAALLPLAAFAFRRGWLLLLLGATLIAPADSRAAEPTADSQAPAWVARSAQLWRDLWSTPDQQAARKLQDGDARAAADRFSDPAWRASARYRAGDYEQAAQNFHALRGADGKTTADADYNRGNALARAGQLQQAIAAYDEALQKKPALDDARSNRKLVEDLLKQQQQTQPDKQSSNQKDSQQQPSQQNQSQQGSPQQQDSSQSQQDSSQQSQQHADDKAQQQNDSATQQEQNRSRQDARQAQQNADRKSDDDAKKQQVAQQQQQNAEHDSQAGEKQQMAADKKPETPEQQRQQQVMEQWLRQIPDEPEGLLRRKFDYEHRQRAQQREPADDRPLY